MCNGAPSFVKVNAQLGREEEDSGLALDGNLEGGQTDEERLDPALAGPGKLKHPRVEPGLAFLPPFQAGSGTPPPPQPFHPYPAKIFSRIDFFHLFLLPPLGRRQSGQAWCWLRLPSWPPPVGSSCPSPKPQAGDKRGVSGQRAGAVGNPSERGSLTFLIMGGILSHNKPLTTTLSQGGLLSALGQATWRERIQFVPS